MTSINFESRYAAKHYLKARGFRLKENEYVDEDGLVANIVCVAPNQVVVYISNSLLKVS